MSDWKIRLRLFGLGLLLIFILEIGVAVFMVTQVEPFISPVTPFASPVTAGVGVRPSKLSVHVGNSPTGLGEYLLLAQPTLVYSLNNCVKDTLRTYSPNTQLIWRIQNDKWDRLPDNMWAGWDQPDWEARARASARYEALVKTMYVGSRRETMNYMDFVKLCDADWVAPMNEPVLGEGPDAISKTLWLNAWYEEWLTIAHEHGIKGSLYSFATGNPRLDLVPYLAGSARLAVQWGGVIDLHEYGIDGGLRDSPTSGALRYRQFWAALPPDARPPIVISEFSSGGGYGTGLSGLPWVNDAVWYGKQIINDFYLLGAAAFQLDQGAESNIPLSVLRLYGSATQFVTFDLYLPVVIK